VLALGVWTNLDRALSHVPSDRIVRMAGERPSEAEFAGRRFELVLAAASGASDRAAFVARASELLADEGRLIMRLCTESQGESLDKTLGAHGLELLEVAVTRSARFAVLRRPPHARPLSLTVGMLTMDEEASVAKMIERIRQHAPDARILCVDSSTKDRTPQIAEGLGARVIRQLPPRGHGPAMELLMYEAARESEALVYLDCDFTYPPEDIPKLRRVLESGADVVNAARLRIRPTAMPFANYLANMTFVACGRLLCGVPIADLHSGMRGYRSSVIRAFSFDGAGDALPVDTLLWPARRGFRVVEIPLEYRERVGASKLRKVSGTAWTFVRLFRALSVGTRRADRYEVWQNAEPPETNSAARRGAGCP
jgi:hypothetical protein